MQAYSVHTWKKHSTLLYCHLLDIYFLVINADVIILFYLRAFISDFHLNDSFCHRYIHEDVDECMYDVVVICVSVTVKNSDCDE